MRAVINFLTAHLKYILILYIAVQLIYVFFFQIPFKSDSLYYFNLAISALNSGGIYPSEIHLYEDYIIAPLFVNLQLFILTLYYSQYSVGLFHLLLNLIQLSILYTITRKYYGKETSAIFALLYIFYLPNIGFVILNMTELLFGVLAGLSLYFLSKEFKSGFLFSGLSAAASVAVRPLGWALIFAILIFILFVHKNEQLKSVSTYVIGVFLFFIVMGTATYTSSGHWVYTSVNYGTNFLIGANDDASGAYNDRVFNPGKKGFIENPESLTYYQKQKYWFEQAVEWIKDNPVEWLQVFPSKLVHIFIWDDYAISPLIHMQEWNLYKMMKLLLIEKNLDQFFNAVPIIQQIAYFGLQIVHHIYYFVIITMFLFLLVKRFAVLKTDKLFILIILLIGSSILIPLFSFGDPRFKYPYILFMMIIISPFISNHFQKTKIHK